MQTPKRFLMLALGTGWLAWTLSLTLGTPVTADAQPPFLQPESAALHPFQARLCIEHNLTGCESAPQAFPVPTVTASGEGVLRLVIEHVSAHCIAIGGPITGLALDVVAGGVLARHHFTPVQTHTDTFVASQAARLYADPGSSLELIRATYASQDLCRLTVSGHLVAE